MNLEKLTIQTGSPILSALRLISREAYGICFVVERRRLVGVLTDGDVRRSLLKGLSIESPVDLAMRRDFFSLEVNTTFKEIQKHLNTYQYIPILNRKGEIVDLASTKQYHQIPMVQPIFDGNELEYVTDCITTGWVSSQGKYVRLFESDFANYVGCPNSLAVANGTVALHLALVTLGIGPGDEVIVPDLTFVAPVNAVLYVGATPVLIDVEPGTMAMDSAAAAEAVTKQTRAIIPVHLYGQPVDMNKIMSLAEKHDLKVIEDCAEAIGSKYQGIHVGNFGHAATFSFYGNKTITTGEGGMLLFRESAMFDRAKILRDHGMSPDRRYWHEELGFNYRLTNIQAAIGVAQLHRIDHFVERKRWIASQYKERLVSFNQLQLPDDCGDVQNSYWLYTVVLKSDWISKRDKIMNALKNNGIEATPVFIPMHRMPHFKKYISSSATYNVANQLSNGGISLPSSILVTDEEIDRVCNHLCAAI